MSTMNYGGTNRNVYYVDATMTDNTGDGLTPQTAFKDLSSSSLVDNSVYIFRRTPKSSYSTITGGTASQIVNIIFMGMPISSDKMYAIIPQEAKDAWNTDEEDNNESHASVLFSGNLHLNNADDVNMFRIRMLHRDNAEEWCMTIGVDSSNCAGFAHDVVIEKCEFTNVNNSLETTTSTFNTNYFARYVWYGTFNMTIKDCDVETNYTAFAGYSNYSHFENIRALMSQQNQNSSWGANLIEDAWNEFKFGLSRYNTTDNLRGGETFVKDIHVRWRYNSSWFCPARVLWLSKNFYLENFTVEEAENHIELPSKLWPGGYFITTYAKAWKLKNIHINLPKEQGRGVFGSETWVEYLNYMDNIDLPVRGNYDRRIENVYIRYFNRGDDKSTFIPSYNGTFDPDDFGTGSITSCNVLFASSLRRDREIAYGCRNDLILGDKTNDHDAGYIIAPYSFLMGGYGWNFEADEIHAGCINVGAGDNIHIKKLYTTASSNILRCNDGNADTDGNNRWRHCGNSSCIVDEIVSYQLTGSSYSSSAITCYDIIIPNIYVGKSNVRVVPPATSGIGRYGHQTMTCSNDIYTGNFVSRSTYTNLISWNTVYGGMDKVVLQFKNTSGSNDRAWFGRSPLHLFGVTPTTAGLKYVKVRMSKVSFTNDREFQYLIRMNVTQNGMKLGDSQYAIFTPDANWHYGTGYNVYIPVNVEDTRNDIYVDFNYTGNDDTGTMLLHPEIELVDSIPELETSSSSEESSSSELEEPQE